MKLATIRTTKGSIIVVGLEDSTKVVRLSDAYQRAGLENAPQSIRELIERGDIGRDQLKQVEEILGDCPSIEVDKHDWCAPIPEPSKILGVAMNNTALNNTAHVDPAGPMFFVKPQNTLVGHGEAIEIGEDYGFTFPELELGVVIGKRAKDVSQESALDYVAGYTIVNDITSQGLKRGDSIAVDVTLDKKKSPGYDEYFNWRRDEGDEDLAVYFTYHARSKGADTFAPMGPWFVTKDEISNPDDLAVRGYADGELFAEDSTSSYSFPVPKIIAWASRYFTLLPGDIITCGTAAKGVAAYPRAHHEIDMSRMTPVVDIEIDGLGRLSNPVVHTWEKTSV